MTVSGHVGGDPWPADDLISSAGEDVERFGDATPMMDVWSVPGGVDDAS